MANSRLERIGTIYSRNQFRDKMLVSLSTLMEQLDKDKEMIRENNTKLNYALEQSIKLSQQTTTTIKQRITGLQDIMNNFNNLVEALMRSKAMKPQDRPLWWDVYRAFPPIDDPVFSRPQPTGPVRKIFYPEDEIRGKFHKSGEMIGAVKLNDNVNKSNTQKLIALYNHLHNTAENPDDKDQLYNESLEMLSEYLAIKSEWREQPEKKQTTKKSQVSSEHQETSTQNHAPDNTIRDIFKE